MLELYTIFKRKFTARHLYYNASLLQSLDLIQHVIKLAWLVNKLPTTHASKEFFVVHWTLDPVYCSQFMDYL